MFSLFSFSASPHVRAYERFAVGYAPAWISVIAGVVAFKFYESFTGWSYFKVGLTCCLPAVALPYFLCNVPARADATAGTTAKPTGDGLETESPSPFYNSYWFKSSVWLGMLSFVGNHFLTYYFFNILGCRYTIPPGFELNGIPLVMHLLTFPYFMTYHVVANLILRKVNFKEMSIIGKAATVFSMAYATAMMEAVSISAFPHYAYPDRYAMYVYGSAFYAMLLSVSYPAFFYLSESEEKHDWKYFLMNSLACCMGIFIFDDFWRLAIGPVVASPLATTAVPYAQV